MLAIEKALYCYGAKTSSREAVLDIPILARKGPVKTLWRILHCFLVNNVTGRENSNIGHHIVQYEL